MAKRTTATSRPHDAATYRSGLESKVAAELAAAGVKSAYESIKVHFTQPEKRRSYTPDFPLPNGIIVETKGRLETDDRQKHKFIKDQHPDLEIRFVFSRSKSKLTKGSPTTYADWCRQYGFKFADVSIPSSWLREPANPAWLAAIQLAGKK